MSLAPKDPLLMIGKGLTLFMQGIMALAGIILILLVPVVLIWQADIAAEMSEELGRTITDFPAIRIAILMLFAAATVGLVFFFFGKLRHIIRTVGEGDPFVPANATRLTQMAWLLLGTQLLTIPLAGLGLSVAKWADAVGNENVTIDAGFDLTGILMVIVLFILARVFREGAAMRSDLEGTV